MNKKVWIRVVGWVGLLGWAAAFFFVWVRVAGETPNVREGATILGGLCVFLGLGATFLWFVASIIDGFMRRQAGLQGAALAQALGGYGRTVGPPVPLPAPAAAHVAPVPNCAQCGTPDPQWWCYQHAVALCDNCGGHHRVSFPACQWGQRTAPPPAPALRPREVITSPLAGMR